MEGRKKDELAAGCSATSRICSLKDLLLTDTTGTFRGLVESRHWQFGSILMNVHIRLLAITY